MCYYLYNFLSELNSDLADPLDYAEPELKTLVHRRIFWLEFYDEIECHIIVN